MSYKYKYDRKKILRKDEESNNKAEILGQVAFFALIVSACFTIMLALTHGANIIPILYYGLGIVAAIWFLSVIVCYFIKQSHLNISVFTIGYCAVYIFLHIVTNKLF